MVRYEPHSCRKVALKRYHKARKTMVTCQSHRGRSFPPRSLPRSIRTWTGPGDSVFTSALSRTRWQAPKIRFVAVPPSDPGSRGCASDDEAAVCSKWRLYPSSSVAGRWAAERSAPPPDCGDQRVRPRRLFYRLYP